MAAVGARRWVDEGRPQTTAVSRSATSPGSPRCFHLCGEWAARSRSLFPNSVKWSPAIFERIRRTHTDADDWNYGRESPERRLYKPHLSMVALRACSRIAGCFICVWSPLKHQRSVLFAEDSSTPRWACLREAASLIMSPNLEELQAKVYPDSGFLFPTVSASRSPGFQHAPGCNGRLCPRLCCVCVSVKLASLSSPQGCKFILWLSPISLCRPRQEAQPREFPRPGKR